MSPLQDQDDMNYAFYDHRPQDYFSRRLALAQELLQDNSEVSHAMLKTADEIMRRGTRVADLSEEERLSEIRKYVASDLEMLKFHTIETLLRYFIGHVSAPDRPWQKIGGLEDRSAFSRDLKALWEEDVNARMNMITKAFFGITANDPAPSELSQVWNKRLAGIEMFLSHYMSYFAVVEGPGQRHRERERYNAAKHGMTLVAVPVAELDENLAHGIIGLAYLEYELRAGNEHWRLKLTWSNFDVLMTEIFYAIMLLDQIWHVGRREANVLDDSMEWADRMDWSPDIFLDFDGQVERKNGQLAWDLDIAGA